MPTVSYRLQVLLLALWIPAVILIFRFLPDRQIAATLAGTGFLTWPLLFLISELKRPYIQKTHVIFLLLFLGLSAIPILFLRIFNWGTPFDQLQILGITGTNLHRFSNYNYVLMLGSAVCAYVKEQRGR